MSENHEIINSEIFMSDQTMSSGIGKLAGALAKAQGLMKAAKKDSTNPFFKSNYADLASVWEAAREALSKNGLAVIQTTEEHLEKVVVITLLAHESGEWIRGRIAMKPMKPDPQGIGSTLTYARRYALASIVGVAPEDDDGNAAAQVKPQAPVEMINAGQAEKLKTLLQETNSDVKKFLTAYGIKDVDSMPTGKFPSALKALETKLTTLTKNGGADANH